ncbi:MULTISPECIES: glycosyltransferase [unclassified Lentimicrobium]|uniref:glycosyltransferase n=1 Tax=unclassified Lentimicrobium TaxID=2677434 RepID=UPI001553B839|nr:MULTISPECIES: glycosyltransferase [unclassified Lentimicrobium]NPD44339.1 glycosyltransferase [Lentimicrobium sp. S6]NPD86893.1 glycosyltransferase [Lentimicrobium sp. L6]
MKNEAKHILFLPQWYPNRYDKMWGLFVKKHAQAANRKNTISVLYLKAIDNILTKTEIEEYLDDGIHSLYIYYPKPKNKISYLFRFLIEYKKGLSLIQKRKPIDLIHVHILTRAGLLALYSHKTQNIPFVITEHWSRYLTTVNTYKGALRKMLTKYVVKNASAVLPVTQNLQEALLSHGLNNNHYRIIPNVVDDIFFQYDFILQKEKTKSVIHVSTFENKSKNITGIIKMVKALAQKRDDFKMILIGDGIDYFMLKELSKEYKLESFIEFRGLLEKQELVDEYMKASFMLVNSNYENMPVVINEAMACGLPVLSTNVGGISEHLDSTKGILIEPKQPEQLLEQFQWMLDHLDSFEPSSIRQYAKEHFSFDAVGKQLDEVYHSINKDK